MLTSQAEAAEFAQVSEYVGHSEAARARSHLADGRAPLLLYTERAHFYHRHRLRGIRARFPLLCTPHVVHLSQICGGIFALDHQGASLVRVWAYGTLHCSIVRG